MVELTDEEYEYLRRTSNAFAYLQYLGVKERIPEEVYKEVLEMAGKDDIEDDYDRD